MTGPNIGIFTRKRSTWKRPPGVFAQKIEDQGNEEENAGRERKVRLEPVAHGEHGKRGRRELGLEVRVDPLNVGTIGRSMKRNAAVAKMTTKLGYAIADFTLVWIGVDLLEVDGELVEDRVERSGRLARARPSRRELGEGAGMLRHRRRELFAAVDRVRHLVADRAQRGRRACRREAAQPAHERNSRGEQRRELPREERRVADAHARRGSLHVE